MDAHLSKSFCIFNVLQMMLISKKNMPDYALFYVRKIVIASVLCSNRFFIAIFELSKLYLIFFFLSYCRLL